MTTLFSQRRRELLRKIDEAKLGGLLVLKPASWYYLTGFTGEAGALVVSRKGTTLVTDGRFVAQAREETRGVKIAPQQRFLMATVAEVAGEIGKRGVGFDGSQLTVNQRAALRKLSGRHTRWVESAGIVESLRMRKDASEVARMRLAATLAGKVIQGALKLLKPGVRELEVAAEIEYQMRRLGGDGPAFETIVAFGERSAHPHARPTGKRLRKNELVVLDLGVILGHYCSDITRTVFVGNASARVRGWYEAVLEAQSAAIATTRSGTSCGDVDGAARGVLARHKLDRYFVHSTGHGLGLEVHEEPRVAKEQKQKLTAGNVITIEPGIYVPGVGGIRIEDDVAVHADGPEVLTRVPRDFIEI